MAEVTLSAKLPLVQENFTRTYRVVDGENVVYVESQLESLLGFDHPLNWAEHATIGSPWLEPGVTVVDVSGSRSRTAMAFSGPMARWASAVRSCTGRRRPQTVTRK